eukprot:591222-Amphidinium_carterae.1
MQKWCLRPEYTKHDSSHRIIRRSWLEVLMKQLQLRPPSTPCLAGVGGELETNAYSASLTMGNEFAAGIKTVEFAQVCALAGMELDVVRGILAELYTNRPLFPGSSDSSIRMGDI